MVEVVRIDRRTEQGRFGRVITWTDLVSMMLFVKLGPFRVLSAPP